MPQRTQVRSLCQHASFVLWCRNSENELGLASGGSQRHSADLLSQSQDILRMHYFDYHSFPWSLHSMHMPPFCWSFALVSFPSMETLSTALGPGDLALPFPQAIENRMRLGG
ncbi:hypothetical protein MRX96_015380 [Rhipicephalus microplus]